MKSLKWILLCTALVVLTVYAISGTWAVDSPTNMKINLSEWQRKEQTDLNTGFDNLEPFVDFKLLVPKTTSELTMAEEGQMWSENHSDLLYSSKTENIVDKFVFVENQGDVPSFVRVWFAFEQGTVPDADFEKVIGILKNETVWSWDENKTKKGVIIGDSTYTVMCAVYTKALEPGTLTTNPSLLQVFMYEDVASETTDSLDGNKNEKYDILVYAEGVQYVENKKIHTLLDDAYGSGHPWDK